MTISKDILKKAASELELELDELALDRFDKYAKLLIEWNEKINLTAITEPTEIIYKHFIDSLILLKYIYIKNNAKIIDVGTGAGFPGIALLIARPDLELTLLDGTKKKLLFLENVLTELDLKAITVHGRAEEAGKDKNYREQYDIVTARAVSNLRDLCEYCLPFAKVGGIFAPFKGSGAAEELKDAKHSIKLLGGEYCKTESFNIENCGDRAVIIIKKISQTSSKYPRASAQIAKYPLV